MPRSVALVAAAVLTGTFVLASPSRPPVGAPSAPAAQSDLDAFMGKVLAKRDENWKKLQQYVLDERELVDVRGPAHIPVWGERRDYTWYIRDGYFVRSPVKVNGVTIAEADRRKDEDEYLRRMKSRENRRRPGDPAGPPQPIAEGQRQDAEGLLLQTRQPEFIDSAYFLRFKFEQGKYALVGRETFDGNDVLRIEYYPAQLFSHEQDARARRDAKNQTNRQKDVDATVEQMMNKVSLVTLWVEPTAHQIVKYTFDNVNFDFLPVPWLLRVQDVKATMTMSKPFKDVWLPSDVDMYIAAMLAVGTFDIRYHLDYHDYKQAETSGRIKAPAER